METTVKTRSAGSLALIWISWACMLAYLIISAIITSFTTGVVAVDGLVSAAAFWSMLCAIVGFGFNCAAIFVKGAWPNLVSAILYAVAWFIGFAALMPVIGFILVAVSCVLSFIAYFMILARENNDGAIVDDDMYDDELIDSDIDDDSEDRVA